MGTLNNGATGLWGKNHLFEDGLSPFALPTIISFETFQAFNPSLTISIPVALYLSPISHSRSWNASQTATGRIILCSIWTVRAVPALCPTETVTGNHLHRRSRSPTANRTYLRG